MKGVVTVKKNKLENENWKRAKTFIEHFRMKNGLTNLSEISRQLNKNGYKQEMDAVIRLGLIKD